MFRKWYILQRGRTTVDEEFHTGRHSIDCGLDRLESLVVWDGIGVPCEPHETELCSQS